MSVLDDILRDKALEVAERRSSTPLDALQEQLKSQEDDLQPRGFSAALRSRHAAGESAVIAEIKRASPSKGLIRSDFQPAELARSYAKGGATCLSVLTDTKYFQGADQFLSAARSACSLPVLRKDFIIDDYQVWETRALGADCLLLIVAALTQTQLEALYGRARELDLDVLVEVHDTEELERASRLDCDLLGVNNRNLKTFETTLETTKALAALAPDDALLVSESGIHTPADIGYLRSLNVHCYLIGEAFMRAADPGTALRALIN